MLEGGGRRRRRRRRVGKYSVLQATLSVLQSVLGSEIDEGFILSFLFLFFTFQFPRARSA